MNPDDSADICVTADPLRAAASSAQALRTAAASRAQALRTAAASRASSAPGVGKQAGSGNPPFHRRVGNASSPPGVEKQAGSGNPPFHRRVGNASSGPGFGKQTGSGNPPFHRRVGNASSAPGFGKQTGSRKPAFPHHVGLKKTVQPPSLVATLVYGVLGMFSLMMLCIVGVCLDMGLQIGMMIIVYFICNYMYGRGYFPFLYRKPMNQIPCTGCRVKNCGFLHVTD